MVSLNAAGESEFMLYREACADSRYEAGEVSLDIAGACRVLHMDSLSLGSPQSGEAQRLAVKTAKEAGALISTDVNFRPAIWSNPVQPLTQVIFHKSCSSEFTSGTETD
jgi:fructokinase